MHRIHDQGRVLFRLDAIFDSPAWPWVYVAEMISPVLREKSQLGLIHIRGAFLFFLRPRLGIGDDRTHLFPFSYQSEPKCVVSRSDIWFRVKRDSLLL